MSAARIPLILAHEALRRLARIAGRRAGIPAEASLSLRLGRWYVHEPQRRPTDYGLAVWPEGDGNGGGWSEYFDRIDRVRVLLGHKDVRTTERYVGRYRTDTEQPVAALGVADALREATPARVARVIPMTGRR